MMRSLVVLCFVGLLVAAPSTAFANAVAKSMGNLRWGMSDTEVTSVVKKALKKEYSLKLKKAKGSSKASVKSEYQRRIKEFEGSLVDFNGRSRWDSTSIGEEYTHGNEESMMVLEGGGSDNYYFFIEGRLWKWVRTMPGQSFPNFKKFSASIKKKFGKGHDKNGETSQGSGRSYDFVEFLDRQSRMRAVDKTGNYNEYALVFEEMSTVRSLSALRQNSSKRNKPTRSQTARAPSPSRSTTVASSRSGSTKRKSIFANEGGDESEDEYRARKQKVLEERERKQRALFERKEDTKKGKVLDELQGIDDNDPLSGMN